MHTAQLSGRGELLLIYRINQVVRTHVNHGRLAADRTDKEIRDMLPPATVSRLERQSERLSRHRGDLRIEVQRDEIVTLTL